jgi:hypothetical protein
MPIIKPDTDTIRFNGEQLSVDSATLFITERGEEISRYDRCEFKIYLWTNDLHEADVTGDDTISFTSEEGQEITISSLHHVGRNFEPGREAAGHELRGAVENYR